MVVGVRRLTIMLKVVILVIVKTKSMNFSGGWFKFIKIMINKSLNKTCHIALYFILSIHSLYIYLIIIIQIYINYIHYMKFKYFNL